MLQQYMATATHKFSLPINEKCYSNCARLMDFWQLLCRVAASVCVHMHFNVCRIILMSFLCLVYHLLSTGLLNVATVTANLTISSNIFCLSKLPLALKGQFDMYFCHLCLHATTTCSLKNIFAHWTVPTVQPAEFLTAEKGTYSFAALRPQSVLRSTADVG